MQAVAYLAESCLGCPDIKAASLSFGADAVPDAYTVGTAPFEIEECWVSQDKTTSTVVGGFRSVEDMSSVLHSSLMQFP
ncbi:hypothetical protein Hte_006687 [Hypoxylon texense]